MSKRNTLLLLIAVILILTLCVGCGTSVQKAEAGDSVDAQESSVNQKSTDDSVENMPEDKQTMYARLSKSVVFINVYDDSNEIVATASGFIINDDKTLVTCYHVIEGAYYIEAISEDGNSTFFKIVLAYDSDRDLAVLLGEKPTNLTPLVLGDSSAVVQGDSISVIGSPLGLKNSISEGIVSALRTDGDTDIVQITAPISSGSSGGAVFDEDGNIIGIVSASFTEGQNLNLAIASNEIVEMMSESSQGTILLSELYEEYYANGIHIPEGLGPKDCYQTAYEKYSPDQTVLRVNQQPVTWAQYYSWIYDIASQMAENYGVDDWNAPRAELASVVPDKTFGTYVKTVALDYVTQIIAIEQKAKELDVELSAQQHAEIQAEINNYIQDAGGKRAFAQLLAESYLPMDYYIEQQEVMVLQNDIYEKLYGANGEKLSEEDVLTYLRDNDYLCAKHILFKTVDDSRKPLPADQIAKKRAEAEAVLSELLVCSPEDLETRFDTLMQQYSEDTGLIRYPDGYYFQKGKMVAPFEKAAREYAGSGLVPKLVESDYGFHIMLCPQMKGDHLMDYDSNGEAYTPKAIASAAIFDDVADEWYFKAKKDARFVLDFDKLDLNELFAQ